MTEETNAAEPNSTAELKRRYLSVRGSLTLADVTDFIREKVPDSSCPMCKQEQWNVSMPSDTVLHVITPVFGLRGETNLGAGFPTIPMSCTNCGFVWSINAEAIWRWILSRRDAAEGGSNAT